MTEYGASPVLSGMRAVIGAILCLVFLLPAPVPSCAGMLTGTEYRVKAGFIYHFARFTDWPPTAFEGPDSPFVLCVAASDPEADILYSLRDKMVRDRKIVVRKYGPLSDLSECHILYTALEDNEMVLDLLEEVRGESVLTVGETRAFIGMGGILSFFLDGEHLRFAVNLNAAEQAGLRFSAQLLMSAEIIRETP